MKYAEEHPAPISFVEGNGHKRLLMSGVTSAQTIYMSSFGFTSEQIASFSNDNFFVTLGNATTKTNKIYTGGSGGNLTGDAGFSYANYNYDSSTGILTINPATLSAHANIQGDGNFNANSSTAIATNVYMIY